MRSVASHYFLLSCSGGRVGRKVLSITRVSRYKIDMNETPEPFNGAELSESVLARDWNSPEEDAAWADL